jgi:hypothetical protein
MADEGRPPVYGLWNTLIGEWFNPGTREPFFPSREAALRMLPNAIRQYAMGKWEVREYPLEDLALETTEAPPPPAGAR